MRYADLNAPIIATCEDFLTEVGLTLGSAYRSLRRRRRNERKGALCYLAAWDARRARIFDRCAPKDGIEPFGQLIEQFMSVAPYRTSEVGRHV